MSEKLEKFTIGPASIEPIEKDIPLIGAVEGADAILNVLTQTVEAGHGVSFRIKADDIYVSSHMMPISHLEEFLTAHSAQKMVLLSAVDIGPLDDSGIEAPERRKVYVIIRRKFPDETKEIHSITDVTNLSPEAAARVYDTATKVAEGLGEPGEYGMRVHYSDKLPGYVQKYLATKEQKS